MGLKVLKYVAMMSVVMIGFQNCGEQEFGSEPASSVATGMNADDTGNPATGAPGSMPGPNTGSFPGATGGTSTGGGVYNPPVTGGGGGNPTTPTSPSKPGYCNDYFMAHMCDIYMYLYNRWPDEAGARYWVEDFRKTGVPYNCQPRRLAIGTQTADCERHKAKWGFYPDNGQLCPAGTRGSTPYTAPTAECAYHAP